MSVLPADAPLPRWKSLRSRRTPLADPAAQLALLDALDLPGGDFEAALLRSGRPGSGRPGLSPSRLRVFQVNVGKLCNMTCRHCHVDAGPDRLESMTGEVVDDCIAAIRRCRPEVVDITGGAPELHPEFRRLVDGALDAGCAVIDRCNLSVLLLSRYRDLPAWLGERGVEIVASLPHPRRSHTDAQRGEQAFERSIQALKVLNGVGYGQGDPKRRLILMHNPAGAFLPGGQGSMEREWKQILLREQGVTFDRLIALNNMPISRFLEWLESSGNLKPYMAQLVAGFNPEAVEGLMCRDTVSVGWDGTIYDCDFNQMLELPAAMPQSHVRDFDADSWMGRGIVTARHCFGCTAGAGSSCAGATAG